MMETKPMKQIEASLNKGLQNVADGIFLEILSLAFRKKRNRSLAESVNLKVKKNIMKK